MFNLNIVNSLFLAILISSSLVIGDRLNAQTVLRPGDLAIVGVNTNLSGCSPEESGSDEISFVCFKDIQPGTSIQLTDNGYERLNPGQWGNSEGFIIATRLPTADVIPAGSLIIFRLPPITTDIEAILPDTDWNFERVSINALNFNSGGDQLYFMQGGIWDEGDTRIGNSEHNATYTGGEILFGFNSKADWVPFANTTQESGLHPSVEPCFHMQPTGGIINYSSYQGPATAATQLEWIARISDPNNWSTFPDCNSYQRPLNQFPINPSGIELNCTTCSGCGQVDEALVFSLPETGGPFGVEFYNGVDTLLLENVSNQDTSFASLTTTATYAIVSVIDANGCPVYSDLGPEVVVNVNKKPIATPTDTLLACREGSVANFNLASLNDIIRDGSTLAVFWYEDPDLTTQIGTPQSYISAPGNNVYATIFDGTCESEPVEIPLAFAPEVNASFTITNPVSCSGAADGSIELETSSTGMPYEYNWNIDALDGEARADGLAAGVYTVTITNANNCSESLTITLSDPEVITIACSESRPASSIGGNDGVANIDIQGGTAPYTVTYDGPDSGTQTFDEDGIVQVTNLTSGNYTLVVTDVNGCSSNCAFTINDPNCNFRLATSKRDATCPDTRNGQIDLIFSNGEAPFNIDWEIDSLDGLQNVTGLAVGTYQVTVTDNRGCSNTTSVNINSINARPTVTLPALDEVCQNECLDLVLNYTGQAPFELPIVINAGKGNVPLSIRSEANVDTFQICPTDYGVTDGDIDVTFLSLLDQTTCPVVLEEQRTLRVINTGERFLDTLICQEDFLFLNGTIYDSNNRTGMERLESLGANGCDSIVNVNLSFFPVAQSNIDTFICASETINVNGTLYGRNRRRGTEVLPNADINGCDSLIFVNIDIKENESRVIDTALCEGESLTVNGMVYDELNPSGTEIVPSTVPGECDSTLLVSVNFLEVPRDTFFGRLCPGASLNINGTEYNEQNPAGREIFRAANGCDSILRVDIDFNFIRESRFDTTICPGEQVIINGTVYDVNTPSGRETIDLPGNQCDSFVVVNLNFLRNIEVRLAGTGTVCPGDSINLVFRVFGTQGIDVEVENTLGEVFTVNNVGDGRVVRVSPAQTTTYSIRSLDNVEELDGCSPVIRGEALIEVRPLAIEALIFNDFGDFNTSCPNSSDARAIAFIDGGVPPYSVSWSTGAVGDTLLGIAKGSYELIVTDDNGCVDRDSFQITSPDSITVEAEVIPPLCTGDNNGAIIINEISGGTEPYEFSIDGQNFRAFNQGSFILSDLVPNVYQVSVQDVNDCTASTPVEILEPAALRIDLGSDQTIRFGDSLQLSPQLNFSPTVFSWRPVEGVMNAASLQPFVKPEQTTTFVLTATDSVGCEVRDAITITIDNSREVFKPTAFSPNGDGVNDRFSISGGSNVDFIVALRVYDRWGNLIYEGRNLSINNPDVGWDGRQNGQLANPGVYVYTAEIQFMDGFIENITGDILLLR